MIFCLHYKFALQGHKSYFKSWIEIIISNRNTLSKIIYVAAYSLVLKKNSDAYFLSPAPPQIEHFVQ